MGILGVHELPKDVGRLVTAKCQEELSDEKSGRRQREAVQQRDDSLEGMQRQDH